MANEPLVRLSKLLSLMLRHQPEKFGLVLDAEGFTPLADVVKAVSREIHGAGETDIVAVVETVEPDKRRFSIVDGDIRANYGHSLEGRIEHEAAEPPETLCHGTHEAAVPVVLREGLIPMKRQYVHLTSDRELAVRVGARRGRAVLLKVAAGAAYRDGLRFYRANDAFWLAEAIPARYVSVAGVKG